MITNIATIQRLFHEAVNRKELTVIDELFSPDFVDHSPGPGQPPGPQGIKKVLELYFAGFPDLNVVIEEIVAFGDTVATRETWYATHNGDYAGIPATGKEVTRTVLHFFHLANDQIIEEWSAGESLVAKLSE